MTAPPGRRVTTAWNTFWYAPAPSLNLAAARVVFALHALWILGSRDLAAISGVPDVFWARVPPGDSWRFLLFPGHASLEFVLQWAAAVALAAAALGVWPRVACFCAGLLLYHLAPLETIVWTPNPFERGFTISVLALLALSFGRSGDALQLFPTRASPLPASPSSEYQWPLRLIQVLLCQVYFIAGFSKLARAGIGWISSENMRGWLLVFGQQDQISVYRPLTLWLADRPLACWAIAVSAIALDLGLIAIVVWPRLRAWLLTTALAFHAGILLTMGIFFLNIPQLLVFVDWAALSEKRRDRVARGSSCAGP
jgi:vitamin K-dependent gamma-carboxylase-like protein